MDATAAAIHGDAVVTVIGADCCREFQMGVRTAARAEFTFDHNICFLEGLVYITLVQYIVTNDIGGGPFAGKLTLYNVQTSYTSPWIRCVDNAVAMTGSWVNDGLRVGIKRFMDIQDMGKLLIFQINRIDSVLSQFNCLCGYDGNRLPSPDTLVIYRETNGFGQTLHMKWGTLRRENPGNTGHGLRFTQVELRNPAVCHWGTQDLYMEQIRNKLIIVTGKQALASRLIISIHADRCLANHSYWLLFRAYYSQYYLLFGFHAFIITKQDSSSHRQKRPEPQFICA